MSPTTQYLRSWSRIARLLQRDRILSPRNRSLSTSTPSSSQTYEISPPSASSLPPSLLPSRSTALRSPYRILHDKPTFPTQKRIKVHPPPPSPSTTHKTPLLDHETAQLALLDPSGVRRAQFSGSKTGDSIRPGDMLHITFAPTSAPSTSTLPSHFNGIVLSIKSRGIDTSVLLRNKFDSTGGGTFVELSVKVFSPTVKNVEVVQRAEGWMRKGKRPRRARLYYLRAEGGRKVGNGKQKKTTGKNHPMPNVEAEVREWARKRKALRGMGLGEGDVSGGAGVGGGRRKKGRR